MLRKKLEKNEIFSSLYVVALLLTTTITGSSSRDFPFLFVLATLWIVAITLAILLIKNSRNKLAASLVALALFLITQWRTLVIFYGEL